MPLFEGPPPFFDNVSSDFRFTVFNKCLEICDNSWDVLEKKKNRGQPFFFYLIAPFYENFMVENCLEDIGDQRFGLLAY